MSARPTTSSSRRPQTSSRRPQTSSSRPRPLTSGGWGTHIEEEDDYDFDAQEFDAEQWAEYPQTEYPDGGIPQEEEYEESEDEDVFAFGLPEHSSPAAETAGPSTVPMSSLRPEAQPPPDAEATDASSSAHSRPPASRLPSLPPSPLASQTVEVKPPISPSSYGVLSPLTPMASHQPLAQHYLTSTDSYPTEDPTKLPLPRPSLLQPESPPSTSTTLSYPLGRDAQGGTFRMRSLPGTGHSPGHQSGPRLGSKNASVIERSIDHEQVHVTLSADGRSGYGKKAGEVKESLYGGDDVSDREGSLKTSITDFDTAEDDDSPYLEVRASVSNIDDPDMPVLTFRLWSMGVGMCILAGVLNTFFNFRYPSPYVSPFLILLLSFPLGKVMAYALPIQTYHFPRWLGGWEFSLNPGPFNIKEHALILIMANVAVSPPYSMNVVVVSELYYKINLGTTFNFLIVLSTQLTGFGFAGMLRRLLVWPASMVWPQNLVASTLLNTLHAEEDIGEPTEGISRYKLFIIVGTAAFFWYFVPGYLFQALSRFSWVCWILPNNIPVNQLFGTVNGLGMGIITFDWTQIEYIGSPLMTPWWAEAHVFVGFVAAIWIIVPILYYTNIWSFAYFPINSDASFDRFAQPYNVSLVLNAAGQFDLDLYRAYSPVYLSATFAILYVFSFAVATASISHTFLYHGQTLWGSIKRINVEKEDVHQRLMKKYPEVPHWWYISFAVTFFVIGIIACYVWPTQLPIWGLLLSVLIPLVYIVPAGFIYALTGLNLGINIIAETTGGVLLPGKPVANMIYKAYALETLENTLSFVQDLKLGHYIKIPPRATFISQVVATFLASLAQVGMKLWLFENVPDMCSMDEPHQLTCPSNQVFYTASVIWGLVGPVRTFGAESPYTPMLYALIFGAVAPIPLWLLGRRFPGSIFKRISVPVVLIGPSQMPPATGINYSSWFLTGFIFQYLMRRRFFHWWTRYNYILSSALDSGTIVSLILVFFILQFPRGGFNLDWWGNQYGQAFDNADSNATPLYVVPPEGLPWTPPTS